MRNLVNNSLEAMRRDGEPGPRGRLRLSYGYLAEGAPMRLREDFCGTALFACEWVKSHRNREAIGVDLDSEVLAWGREHNLTRLGASAASRLTLLQTDVMEVRTAPVDIVAAFNFSYWIFRERALLRRYFESVRAGLARDGISCAACHHMVLGKLTQLPSPEPERAGVADVRKREPIA